MIYSDGVISDLEKLDPVMSLGFPLGQKVLEKGVAETSPSTGTIRKIEKTIYVTAPITKGNSGGPVFDKSGNVIGISSRIYSESMGICIKITHAIELLPESVRELVD